MSPSTPLSILILNWLDRENPQAGGAEIHLHEIFGRLASRGHSITLVASAWPGAPRRRTVGGIDVHRCGGRYTFSLAAPRYCRRTMGLQEFDLVVEDLNKVPLFTPLWSRRPVVLLVHHLFGATAFQEAGLPLATATWLLERPVPRVFRDLPTIAVSESTREDLVRRGMREQLIEVIPNGVDVDRLAPHPDVFEFDQPTVLYLGRLKKYKRVDLVLRAIAKLGEQDLSCRLLVAGRGDHEPALRTLASRLEIEDRVDFLGFVSEERKLELFRRSWVHTLTSPKEGWGIANLEAAACGTPTVASDSPGLRDSVVSGETGLLVPHGRVDRLAGAIGELVRDADTRRAMSRNARAFAMGYSWDASAEATERYLERVVGGSRRS